MKIKIEEIKQLCADILLKEGLSKEESQIIVKEYLYGELRGEKSHGFASFLKFAVEKINSKKGELKILKEDDAYALIDANGNIGQLVGKYAMELAITKAKKTGIAIVGIKNMESYLMPGYYANMASEKNMIGIAINNSKSRVAPSGGTEPKLGTNPIGLAIPTNNVSFILDMATSTRAMSEVRLAEKLGELLSENMALNEDGKPTRDPDKVNALNPFGGYKGYGLCMGIEILAGSFVRAKMGSKIKNGLDRGYLFVVINPEIFVDIETFKEETTRLIQEIKSSQKSKGVDKILIAGERAEKLKKENLHKGYFEIDEKIVEEIWGLLLQKSSKT
ncbi:MAG: Ldh family oxidoreductase [Candidatus Aenigmarchaeota archaeon]|nr:Ldh family oxidoreductase [Candidatus Aenigmarchaeota archaeon]